MKRDEIKASVKWDWDHPNCKFLPGDEVIVDVNHEVTSAAMRLLRGSADLGPYSRPYLKYNNHTGKVIAVSCTPDGKIRGIPANGYARQFTRYYVEFPNGDVIGYHSHHLEKREKAMANANSGGFRKVYRFRSEW